MPFHLWPAQLPVLWGLQRGGLGGRQNPDRLTIILKARQLGISWICCLYALWLCLFQAGKVVLLFSRGKDEAKELLRRIKELYRRLPDWMRESLPTVTDDNDVEFAWTNGSRVQSLAASPHSGSGYTASLVILDEASKLLFGDTLYAALKPTIDGGGQLIVLSTANGIGNLFHRLWLKAQEGLSGFRAIFLPWWSRPERDADWYAAQLREYDDPALVRQEYPASATEAFLVSGRTRFQPDWIARQAVHVQPGFARKQWPAALHHIDGLTVYTLPRPGRRTVIGADVAEGLEHGDYSNAVVLDAETWEELASLHGHWEPDEYAGHLDTLARAYDAELAVERNNHGHAVLVTLKALRTPKVVSGHDDKRGWLTNAQTKPQSIDLLAEALRDDLVTVRSQATLNELQIYRVLKNGSTGAPEGYHDDRVMAWAIALQIARRPQKTNSAGAAGGQRPLTSQYRVR